MKFIFGTIGCFVLAKLGWPYIVRACQGLCNTKKRLDTLLGIADEFKNNHGSSLRDRVDAIYNGAFGNVAYDYIHPTDEVRSLYDFQPIMGAFANAYV